MTSSSSPSGFFSAFCSSLFYSCVKNSSRLGFYVYNRLEIIGRERLPAVPCPVVVASNHCSNLDPLLVGSVFPWKLRYLAKRSLFEVPVLGRMIEALGAIPVVREDQMGAGAVLKMLLGELRQGSSVLVFPEGTRSVDGRLGPLEGGSAFLAAKANVPLVPVHVSGTFKAFPRGSSFPRPSKIRVRFGDPIDPRGYEPGARVRERLLEELETALKAFEKEAAADG